MTAMGKKEARGMAKYEGGRKDMGRSVAQFKGKQKIGNRLCIKLEKLWDNRHIHYHLLHSNSVFGSVMATTKLVHISDDSELS